jgi:hypothetical protein
LPPRPSLSNFYIFRSNFDVESLLAPFTRFSLLFSLRYPHKLLMIIYRAIGSQNNLSNRQMELIC